MNPAGRRRWALAWALTAGTFVLSPAVADAATITVPTTADTSASQCTLRDAIASANNNGNTGGCAAAGNYGDDTIKVTASGTINLGSPLPDLESNMTIEGPEAGLEPGAALDLHRASGGDYRILTVPSGAVVTIKDLSITNGKFSIGGPGGFIGGGGILNEGDLALYRVRVADNQVTFGSGGGIRNQGSLLLVDSTVSGNSVDIDDFAAAGGGIANAGSGAVLAIVGSTVSVNTASSSTADPSITAEADGGGIANRSGTTSIRLSTVSSNAVSATAPDPTHARERGGGIWSSGSVFPGTTTLTSATVAFNFGAEAANLDASGQETVRNTILSDPLGGGANCAGTVETSSFNIAFPATAGCGIAALNVDPLLGPLADNDGPTQTHALSASGPGASSPALDAGNSFGDTFDQRGLPRPVDLPIANTPGSDGADIGAVEIPNADSDADGVSDVIDNCPLVGNSDQANNDGDAQGDACDPDDDNDGIADGADSCDLIAAATPSGCPAASGDLSLRYARAARAFKGKLTAVPPAPGCQDSRAVTVYKRRRGPDRKLATAKTSSSGAYAIKRRRRPGRYYTKSPAVLVTDVAACGGDRSRAVRIR